MISRRRRGAAAAQEPDTAAQEPDTAAQEPDTAAQAPDTAAQAPDTAAQAPTPPARVSPTNRQQVTGLPPSSVLPAANQLIALRKVLFYCLLVALGVQLLVSDAAVAVYFFATWPAPGPRVIEVFFAATVAQVIGAVAILARSLFPRDDPLLNRPG